MTYIANEQKYIVKKLLGGSKFRIGGFIVARLLQAVRVVIFARLFLPADLGTTALAVDCVVFASLFANFGFSQSIIRSKDNSPRFVNTVFTLSVIFGSVMFVLTLVGAPIFSRIFSADIEAYVRFLAVIVFGIPLSLPRFFWEKEIEFKHPSIALLVSELIILLVSVILEIRLQLGIWSLLIGYLSGFLLTNLYIWIFTKYHPKIELERKYIKPLLGFGTPLMIQGLNGQVMSRGDNMMVGAYAGTIQLAYYNFAWQLPTLISSLTSTIDSMLFPVYARLDSSQDAIIRLFNLTNKFWSITGSFIGCFIILYANEIVLTLYGSNWNPAIPILQVMAVSFTIRFCTGYAYDNLALVRGRTKYIMKWGLVNTLLIFTVGAYMIQKIGPIGGAWFWTLQVSVLAPMVRLPLIYQELHTLEFLQHIWQPILAGIVAALCAYWFRLFLPLTDSMKLIISITTYVAIYPALLFTLDRKLIADIRKLVSLALS